MTFDPLCPDLVSKVSVSGISYLGNKLSFLFAKDSVTLEVTARAEPWAPLLEAELWPSLARLPLPPGRERSLGMCVTQVSWCVASRINPLSCRTQGLLSPLSWPDTKVTPIDAQKVQLFRVC